MSLEETLTTHPEVQIEIERVVADDPEQITPYVWVHVDDFDTFEAALEDDPTVEDVTLFSETEEESLSKVSIDFVSRL
ncbi:bacterio-opsin activator domain-containing protein [Halalkalicoccus salilacus]|uniref:bacterio-opsin activator domain-containing protein n=1 Tax=Halalkalicoccus TaxID=332246 RepID=UPI0036214417